MAASVSGRSRHGMRSAPRTHRSKATARPKTSKARDEGGVAPKPDLDELRRKRLLYLSASPEARRESAARSAKKTKDQEAAASQTKSVSGEHRRRRRKHKSSSVDKAGVERGKPTLRSRTEEYVYGVPAPPTERHGGESEGSKLDMKRRSTRSSSSRRDNLPTVFESEVTPDDSVSQIGLRPAKESTSTLSSPRSSPRRSGSNASSRLQPISESTRVTSTRSSKRDSTPSLLSSMFRRNTAPPVPAAPRLVECLTCGSDDVPHARSAKLACGHRMCHDCLKRIFEMSVKDPAHMPPRCCTKDHIPLKHVEKLFDMRFKTSWNRKYQEYHTKNRIYCTAPKCGEWIKPSHIRSFQGRRYAQCPRCSTKVCTSCNGKMHKSSECPKDPEIAKLVEQAKEKGWKTCYNCHAMVELKEGCNHMTCRCLAEFCMVCSKKWKTCDCPWFNYTQTPDADGLNDLRIPEPIQAIYRRAFGVHEPANQQPHLPLNAQPADHRRRQRTYIEEIEHRRQQERTDADLARRMQLASLLGHDEEQPGQRGQADVQTWGLGNAGGHFMNDNFVQNAANVVMSAFGDAAMGRRGDRSSGRRRRARDSRQDHGDAGLARNFLGDESVVGAGPAWDRTRAAP
ncbi:Hypothetical predicted protein [Lecanosticta acicola]|uniref:RBR-type E3 ubiquitin transferase n=1 Tax=Lecanosticta acicola TaxID=111012 RepID=A0AAI8Z3B3_9PEZI|nr:Hypothetical predicted protein [Lecanosticta acicola]